MELFEQEQQQEGVRTEFFDPPDPELFASLHAIHFPLPDSGPLMAKVT